MKKVILMLAVIVAPALSYADYYLVPGGAPLYLNNGERVWCGQREETRAVEYSCVCRSNYDKNLSLGVTVVTRSGQPGAGKIQQACAELPYFKYQPAAIRVDPSECRRN